MKFKTVLFILICISANILFAQKASIKWTNEIETKTGQLGYDGEYKDSKYTYSIESFAGKSILTTIDKNNKSTKQDVVSKNKDYGIKVDYIFSSNNGTYLIIRGVTKKLDKAMIGYMKVTNGVIDNDIKQLITYDYDGGNYGDYGTILQSKDDSKLAINYNVAPKGSKGTSRFNYLILDNNMNIVQKINKVFSYYSVSYLQHILDNEGNLSVLFKKFLSSKDELPEYRILKFSVDNNYKNTLIKIPNAYVEDISINKNASGKQVIVGTYFNEDNSSRWHVYGFAMGARTGYVSGVNGVFIAQLDTGGISNSKKYPFSTETILSFDVSKKYESKGIGMLEFTSIINNFDNTITIFLEESSKSSTKTTFNAFTPYSRTSTSNSYYTNSIIVTKLNLNGDLIFSTTIDKKCKYGDLLDYGSYFPFFKEDNLYVLYNKLLIYEEKKKDLKDNGKVLSELIKINNVGTIVSTEILFGNKDADLILTPLDCSIIDDNKIKLVGVDKKKYKYGILEVK